MYPKVNHTKLNFKMVFMQKWLEYYKSLYFHNRSWLKGVGILFLVSVGIGMLAFISYPSFVEMILEGFEGRFGSDPAMDMRLVLQIFMQNCLVLGVALIGGAILGITSLFVVVVNGLLIGYIIAWLSYLTRDNILLMLGIILGGLVPHGLLEIPAFLVVSALGLKLGWEWMADHSHGHRLSVFKKNLKQAIVVVPSIVAVLFVAALIEVYVSGWIVSKL